MTRDHVLEVERLIAAIKGDLLLIEGSIHAKDLVDIVEQKGLCMFDSLHQLARLLWSTIPQPIDWSPRAQLISEVIGSIEMPIIQIFAPTQKIERRPEDKTKLVDAVAKGAPLLRSALDEVIPTLGAPEEIFSPQT